MYRLKINQEGNNFILVEGSNLEEVKRTADTYLKLSGVPEVTKVIYEQVWQEIGEPKYEPSSYSCRACGSYSQDRIKKLEEALRKYADLNIIFPLWTARFGKYSTTAMAWTNRHLERRRRRR